MSETVDANELASYFEGKGDHKLARIYRRIDDSMPVQNAIMLARHNGYPLEKSEIQRYITDEKTEAERKLMAWRMKPRLH